MIKTFRELSRLTGLTAGSLRNRHCDGRLPLTSQKSGRSLEFDPVEVRAWVSAGMPSSQEWRASADTP